MKAISAIDSILFPEGRSMQVIPTCDHYAGSEKLILKSIEIQSALQGTFDITCDLEDGAAVGDEELLRKRVCEIVGSTLNEHQRIGVRLHDFESDHFWPDLGEVVRNVGEVVSHITVPKVNGFAQAKDIVSSIHQSCGEHKLERRIPVHLLIETHGGVHEVWEIAGLPGIRGLDFGLMDFVSAHFGALRDECMRSPGQFEHAVIIQAKASLVAACLAHGVTPVHNVTIDFGDPQRTFNDAVYAKNHFGFLRMWSIHPNQINQILTAFQPDPAEVIKAAAIIEAAHAASWAPIRYEDHLHDRASFRYYWSVLDRARMAGLPLPIEIEALETPVVR